MKSDWSRNYSDSPTMFLSPTSGQSCNAVSLHPFNQHFPPFKPFTSSQSHNFSQRIAPGSSFSTSMSSSRKRPRDESPEVAVEAGSGHQSIGSNTRPEPINWGVSSIFRRRSEDFSSSQIRRTVRLDDRCKPESAYDIDVSGLFTNNHQDAAPRLRRKYQRRNMSSGSDAKGICRKISNSPMNGTSEPAVDQFTRLLGVGWARISDDKDVQAAARGWSRYIENHYPLSKVSIMLRSKGLEANLAETKDGYFLFKDDLSEGQLVGSDWESCLANLQRKPIAFQGLETLKAAKNPAPQWGASSNSVSTCKIDSNLGSLQIETSWLWREDDEMVVG